MMDFEKLLTVYGITFFFVESSLLKTPRAWLSCNKFLAELLSCFFCLGFWVSLFISFVFVDVPNSPINWVSFVCTHFMNGFAGAAFTYGFNTLLEALERHYGSRS